MTLYLDTSALVKLYVAEAGSATVRAWTASSGQLVTVRVTYAEARATLARMRRSGELSTPDFRRAVGWLEDDWRRYNVVDCSEAVVHRAGVLAERHALRGYDAMQLAAAVEARPDAGEYLFASFDLRLNAAAAREGLRCARGPADVMRDRPSPAYRPRVAAPGRSR